jgi:hypothetical protein
VRQSANGIAVCVCLHTGECHLVGSLGGGTQLAVSGDDVHGKDVVAGEAHAASQIAPASTERQARHARVAHHPWSFIARW